MTGRSSSPARSGPRIEPRDLAVLLAGFRERLEESRYPTIYRLHCHELAPRFLTESLARTLPQSPPRARLMFRLFYFGEAVERAEAAAVLGTDLLDRLLAADVLAAADGRITCPYRVDIAGDTLLFTVDLTTRRRDVYFGEDSQFLRAILRPRAGEVCLDLCAGTGVQGLRCAQVARHVDLVEKHPGAARVARLNVALNAVADRVTVFTGDLWDALPEDRRYDYVVSNPPLMPVADSVPFPLFGHAGADGLRIVGRILAGLPTRLTADGRCTVIGACTGDEGRPDVAGAAARLGDGFAVTLYLLHRSPIADWIRLIADTAVRWSDELSLQNAVLRSRAAYAQLGKPLVYTYLLTAARAETAFRCEVIDYSGAGDRSFWFVNRGMLAL